MKKSECNCEIVDGVSPFRVVMMMMAMRLDAICAKLKLSKGTSESGISKSENNNCSESLDVISRHSLTLAVEDSDKDQSAAGGRISFSDKTVAPSSAAAAFGNSSSAVGRRSRRKNFQPKCIQDVNSEEIPEEKLDLTKVGEGDGSGEVDEVDACSDLQVLDLRMANTSHKQESMRKYRNEEEEEEEDADGLSVDECGVIDLSLRRTDDMRTLAKSASRKDNQSEMVKLNFKTSHNDNDNNNAKDVSLSDGDVVSCSSGKQPVDEDLPMNEFALHSINKLLKIYGLEEEEDEQEEEEGDGDSDFNVKCLPLPLSSTALLWNSEFANTKSVLGKCNIGDSSSTTAEVPVSCDDDLDRTQSLTSSTRSMEANVSFYENSSLPGLLVKSKKYFFPFLVVFVLCRVKLS